MSPTELKEKEADTGSFESSSGVDDLEKSFAAPSAPEKNLPDGHPSKKRKASIKNFFKSKKAIIGIVTITFALSGALFINLTAGAFELIHLANILNITSQPTESMMRTRSGSMLRNARAIDTGDIGESRVSRIGSRIYGNVISQLSDIGIEFTDRSVRTGRPANMTIDPSRHPQFRNLSPGQQQAAVTRHFGIDSSRITTSTVTGADGVSRSVFNADLRGYSAGAVRSLADTSLGSLEDGRVKTSLNKRVMARFFNVPSLFRPFQRARAEIDQRLDTRAQRRDTERQRKASKRPTLLPRYQSAINTARNRLSGWSGRITGVLVLQDVYCNMHAIRSLLPLVNYAQVVVPSVIESVDKRAVAAQLQASDNISLDQANMAVEGFTYNAEESIAEIGEDNLDVDEVDQMRDNDGKSIWSAKALNALMYNNEGQGQEINPGYKFAFAGQLQGQTMASVFESSRFGDYTCSTAGLLLGGALGIALGFIPGPGWKARAVISGGQALLYAAAFNIITDIVIDRVSEHAMEVFSGPQGGNLFAYGSVAENNINVTSMGGVELSDTQTAALLQEAQKRERIELAEKSFIDRLFDPSDHRSVLARSHIAMKTQLEKGVPSMVASVLSNMLRTPANLANALSSNVRANTNYASGYDWGFPIYGIPLEILENDEYEDPYYNAEVMVGKLDDYKYTQEQLALHAAGEIELSEDGLAAYREIVRYMQRIFSRVDKCFGANITERSNEWTVLRQDAINHLEDDYIEADCNNFNNLPPEHRYGPMSGDDWTRAMLFVFDNSIMTALDCYEGGRESCQDLGL